MSTRIIQVRAVTRSAEKNVAGKFSKLMALARSNAAKTDETKRSVTQSNGPVMADATFLCSMKPGMLPRGSQMRIYTPCGVHFRLLSRSCGKFLSPVAAMRSRLESFAYCFARSF